MLAALHADSHGHPGDVEQRQAQSQARQVGRPPAQSYLHHPRQLAHIAASGQQREHGGTGQHPV